MGKDLKDELVVGGTPVARGTRAVVRVPVYTDLDGAEIALFIHVVRGARPGAVFAMHTALHGSEWQTAEITRRLVEGLVPSEMRGTVLAVPVANPTAFATRTRSLRDESDGPDLNRAFGGTEAWIADQLGRALATHLISPADALMDFHSGLWGAAMGSVTCGRDFKDPAVSSRAFEMARAFGLPHIRRGDLATRFPGPKSSVGYAGEVLGVPGLIAEIGGAGFDPELEEQWIGDNVRGIRQVLQHLGILAGTPSTPDRVLVFDTVKRVNPTNAGMVEPIFPPEQLMKREVEAGELLGRVWSPHTFEVIEELRAPFRGLVDMVARAYPARPGDWAYLVVSLDAPSNKWLGRGELP